MIPKPWILEFTVHQARKKKIGALHNSEFGVFRAWYHAPGQWRALGSFRLRAERRVVCRSLLSGRTWHLSESLYYHLRLRFNTFLGMPPSTCTIDELDAQVKLGMDWFLSWEESDEGNGEWTVLSSVYSASIINGQPGLAFLEPLRHSYNTPLLHDLVSVLFGTGLFLYTGGARRTWDLAEDCVLLDDLLPFWRFLAWDYSVPILRYVNREQTPSMLPYTLGVLWISVSAAINSPFNLHSPCVNLSDQDRLRLALAVPLAYRLRLLWVIMICRWIAMCKF
ncbi:hypothetical protein ARMSODRAFT_976175 [Armillaria solidipes]|uniref:Uncharacterized protein n=1 Tax=Armillaria solidipes TaxID=1076256 RepID=A0A2H3BQP1_9AGAR|nr:hypothetical protein ARMSODRAFT_976175 [Armillaria solidipes]